MSDEGQKTGYFGGVVTKSSRKSHPGTGFMNDGRVKFEQLHDGDNRAQRPERPRKMIAVVATPRSGSTSLYYTLKKASGGLYGISEPSNYNMFKFRPADIVNICRPFQQTSKWEADTFLSYLVSRGVEIAKLMVGEDHNVSDLWPWGVRTLVTHRAVSKAVLIYRENIFKQAMSMCIATNTQYWHGSRKEYEEAYTGGIGKISLYQFIGCLEMLRSVNDHILATKQISMAPGRLYVVKYEDFYETPLEEQSKHWEQLHEFLGFDYSSEMLSHEPGHWGVDKINSMKHNGLSTYATIDNLSDIEEAYQAFVQRDAEHIRDMIKERQHLATDSLGVSSKHV